MNPAHYELFTNILARPRMYTRAESLHELLLFRASVCTGIQPPHGSGVLGDFPQFLEEWHNSST